MTPAQRGCWERGFEHGVHGGAPSGNPYRASWARRSWDSGLVAARELLRRNLRLPLSKARAR